MLLRKHKIPEMFSEVMATFFANFMTIILIVWGIAYIVFIEKIVRAYSADFSTTVDGNKATYGLDEGNNTSSSTGDE